jgi:T5SS/PEP-CTERM-associated repeat protein
MQHQERLGSQVTSLCIFPHLKGFFAVSLALMVPCGNAAADAVLWDADSSYWFDDGNWDTDAVPLSGDSVTVNENPDSNFFQQAFLSTPDADVVDEFFKSGIYYNDRLFKLYRIGSLVVANGQGPISVPALKINLSGSGTTGGIEHGFGLQTGPVSIGKNGFNGRVDFAGGIWKPSSISVGDNAVGYLKQNGGLIQTQFMGVGPGTYDSNLGKLSTDNFYVGGSFGAASAKLVAADVDISNIFQNQYGGVVLTQGSAMDIGYSASPSVACFTNDGASTFSQIGSSITVHGRADLLGGQTIEGQGYFSATSARLNPHVETNHFFQILDTSTAELGVLEMGTGGYTTSASLFNSGTVNATSLLMGQNYFNTVPSVPMPTTLSLYDRSQLKVLTTLVIGGPGAGTTLGSPATLDARGAGATATSKAISVSQSASGTGLIKSHSGGKVTATGNLYVGDGPSANGVIEVYDSGSEIKGLEILIAGTPGSTGTAHVYNGGSLAAPLKIVMGSSTGTSDASLLVGGPITGGGYYTPGAVNSSVVQRAGSTNINTRVIFQHSATSYDFPPRLENIDLVTNNGPGRTTLSGQIKDTGLLQATAGILEITQNAVANTAGFLVAQGAGHIEINGAVLKTPDVAFAKTLIGVLDSGEVTVKNAGRLESAIAIGGAAAGSSGTLNVQGLGSTVLVTGLPLRVPGAAGHGSLNITGGGKVINNDPTHATDAIVGDSAPAIGSVIISGFSSRWNVGSLSLGNQGKCDVYVEGGGVLSAGTLAIGNVTGSSGTLTINSGGNVIVGSASMNAGNSGKGEINLNDGGSLQIGPTGQGNLQLQAGSAGTGFLDINGGATTTPGVLLAKNVYGNSSDPERCAVRISHRTENYVFSPRLYEVSLQLGSGNLGTTTLTSSDNFLDRASITSGGLRLAAGSTVYMDSELVVGDGGTFDLDDQSLPFLEMDGQGAIMNAANGILVGKEGDGEVRLKNGGKLIVRDSTRQARNALNLGDDTTTYGRDCSVVFGGSSTTAPGTLDASFIYSYATNGKVTFNHSASDFMLNADLAGSLKVEQLAGTSLLTGFLDYTGTTKITGGTLLITHNLSSVVSIFNNATFGGKGTVARINANSGSTISPGTFLSGDGIASLRVTALNFFGGSKVQTDLGPNRTSDKILNHQDGAVATTLFPVTSGTITFNFRNRGMNQNGVYPVMTTTSVIPAAFMNRLAFSSDFYLQGSFQQTRITNDPQSANPYSQLEFVVTSFAANSAYDTWAIQSYGLDPATSGAATADPDHDGLQNMVEFIVGSSPVSGASDRLPLLSLTSGGLKFSFNRRLMINGFFTTGVEYSTDLTSWTSATPTMLAIGPSDDEGFEPVTYTIPVPPGTSKLFGRLRVTKVSP